MYERYVSIVDHNIWVLFYLQLLGISVIFEPISGLGTSYQYVKSAATLAERYQRIATLASFFAASASALTTDPVINASMGNTIALSINTF